MRDTLHQLKLNLSVAIKTPPVLEKKMELTTASVRNSLTLVDRLVIVILVLLLIYLNTRFFFSLDLTPSSKRKLRFFHRFVLRKREVYLHLNILSMLSTDEN